MSTQEKRRKKLFEIHNKDLRQIYGEIDDVIICPLCLGIFNRVDLIQKNLTDGHVWPDGFTKIHSNMLKANQRVLLCQTCNSKSGTYNDASLIEFTKARLARDNGQYVRPKTEVKLEPTNKILDLGSLWIKEINDRSIRFRFPKNLDYSDLRDPRVLKIKQFLQHSEKGNFTFFVRETYPGPLKWSRSRVSLLTCGYLMAFYTLGYSYILHSNLDETRAIIQRSFRIERDKPPVFEDMELISVNPCTSHFYAEPQIDFYTSTSEEPHVLEVSFADYHIRLPYIHSLGLSEVNQRIVMRATGHRPHKGTCFIEKCVGEPNYLFVNNTLFTNDKNKNENIDLCTF